jgi:hypothetical protein
LIISSGSSFDSYLVEGDERVYMRADDYAHRRHRFFFINLAFPFSWFFFFCSFIFFSTFFFVVVVVYSVIGGEQFPSIAAQHEIEKNQK